MGRHPVRFALETFNRHVTRIEGELVLVNKKIDRLLEMHSKVVNEVVSTSDLLTLPKHLQTTYLVLLNEGEPMTAPAVSKITGKARAVESMYLCHLVQLGLISKHREKHSQLFELRNKTP